MIDKTKDFRKYSNLSEELEMDRRRDGRSVDSERGREKGGNIDSRPSVFSRLGNKVPGNNNISLCVQIVNHRILILYDLDLVYQPLDSL